MRFLIINNHCITDPTAGVSRCQFTVAKWLVEAGHECHVVTTSRFEYQVPFTCQEHLERLHTNIRWDHDRRGAKRSGCRVARFRVDGVSVQLLVTHHQDETQPDRAESDQYVRLVERELDRFRPDVLIACNGHEMIRAAMRESQARGVITVFTVRGYGYDQRCLFDEVDHVFTCSQHLTRVLFEKTGIPSTPLSSPIDSADVLSPSEHRKFLTFVNPSP
ncbi:MAG: glycosyltransferase, partial [Planctomycetota bacterium]|nr:glycosyltransferase [Planctomycetota bacterium]